jgi:TonB-dependent SusC/RagA subfamily outer membrane receptor
LVISYIGYQTQEIPAGNSGKKDITMQDDSELMDEVVVIGYGTQRKGDVTSAISSVKSESFVKGAVTDAGQLIQGKVAGLNISLPSGDPTGNTQIMLRGISSLKGGTSPLVLVDGVPGSLNTVAPEDVESIDVLKDGSATAIYGTRGTNGVIIITTKQSRKEMAPTIDYNGYVSVSNILNRPDFINQPDLAQTFVVTCALMNIPFRFSGLQSLKIKETDRMAALIQEMGKLGYILHETDDRILSWEGERCEMTADVAIDTYEDHRMAMAFAPACVVMPEIRINNPQVVSKSYPYYWEDLKKAGFIIEEV